MIYDYKIDLHFRNKLGEVETRRINLTASTKVNAMESSFVRDAIYHMKVLGLTLHRTNVVIKTKKIN